MLSLLYILDYSTGLFFYSFAFYDIDSCSRGICCLWSWEFIGQRERDLLFLPSLTKLSTSLRANDSALRADQQKWRTASEKPLPFGYRARGTRCPGTLPGRVGCFVSGSRLLEAFPIDLNRETNLGLLFCEPSASPDSI